MTSTSYQSAIVNNCSILYHFENLKNIATLKYSIVVTRPAHLCTICTSLKCMDLDLSFCCG